MEVRECYLELPTPALEIALGGCVARGRYSALVNGEPGCAACGFGVICDGAEARPVLESALWRACRYCLSEGSMVSLAVNRAS